MLFYFHSFWFGCFGICFLGSINEPFLNCTVKLRVSADCAAHIASDVEIEFASNRSVLPDRNEQLAQRCTLGNDVVKVLVNSILEDTARLQSDLRNRRACVNDLPYDAIHIFFQISLLLPFPESNSGSGAPFLLGEIWNWLVAALITQ